jgi:hypothetical protein
MTLTPFGRRSLFNTDGAHVAVPMIKPNSLGSTHGHRQVVDAYLAAQA